MVQQITSAMCSRHCSLSTRVGVWNVEMGDGLDPGTCPAELRHPGCPSRPLCQWAP